MTARAQIRDNTSQSHPQTFGEGRLHWYVVQSKPREEERAKHFLTGKGFHVYLPQMEVVCIRGFHSGVRIKPLFPRYLFCCFQKSDETLAQVKWTKGVSKILPVSANPYPVEYELVDSIRNLEQKDGIIRKQPLKRYDRIRISRGPMRDILGIFEHWTSDKGRVRVLLNFINYQARVELHHSMVERVTHP
jgi:transcriptional antiterminator RfaH